MTATARDLLATKNSAVVYTCAPDTSVAEASRIMRDWRVGALVVVRDAEVLGILTEREVVKRVVAEGLDASSTAVHDVMQREVATVRLEADVADVEATLRVRKVHYVPVVADRGLVGVVSIGDLARFQTARQRVFGADFAPAPC